MNSSDSCCNSLRELCLWLFQSSPGGHCPNCRCQKKKNESELQQLQLLQSQMPLFRPTLTKAPWTMPEGEGPGGADILLSLQPLQRHNLQQVCGHRQLSWKTETQFFRGLLPQPLEQVSKYLYALKVNSSYTHSKRYNSILRENTIYF